MRQDLEGDVNSLGALVTQYETKYTDMGNQLTESKLAFQNSSEQLGQLQKTMGEKDRLLKEQSDKLESLADAAQQISSLKSGNWLVAKSYESIIMLTLF